MPNSYTPTRVCFTGHRSIDTARSPSISCTLNGVVQSLINHGATDFYTGGALGFDTLAALTVLRLRHICPNIRLHLILPCKTQTKLWSERDKFVYEQILLSADSVEYVQESYTSGCMHERNRRLVDSAELCVAYCEHSGGGTAYTVAYALKNEKELINIADLI